MSRPTENQVQQYIADYVSEFLAARGSVTSRKQRASRSARQRHPEIDYVFQQAANRLHGKPFDEKIANLGLAISRRIKTAMTTKPDETIAPSLFSAADDTVDAPVTFRAKYQAVAAQFGYVPHDSLMSCLLGCSDSNLSNCRSVLRGQGWAFDKHKIQPGTYVWSVTPPPTPEPEPEPEPAVITLTPERLGEIVRNAVAAALNGSHQ